MCVCYTQRLYPSVRKSMRPLLQGPVHQRSHTRNNAHCTHNLAHPFSPFLHTYPLYSLTPFHPLCTQSGILMCSLRDLLFCLCHNPSIYTPFLTTPSDGIKTVQHSLSYSTVVYTIITQAQMAFRKLRISSSSHYNEAIFLSTACQFVSFHVNNKSDIPH